MSESATFRARVMPVSRLAPFLWGGGTIVMGLAVLLNRFGTPLFLTIPLLSAVVAGLARRRALDAEYYADATGLRERLTPVRGGAPTERHWSWGQVVSYQLAREPTRTLAVRNVLVVRFPGARVRVREPLEGDGRDAYARFVDRFVGYATGDVASGAHAPDSDAPRDEAPHRRPLTSGEAPQLRRTLAQQPAYRPQPADQARLLDRPVGRAIAAGGALGVLGLLLAAWMLKATLGGWAPLVLILVPTGLWLAWRALWSGDA